MSFKSRDSILREMQEFEDYINQCVQDFGARKGYTFDREALYRQTSHKPQEVFREIFCFGFDVWPNEAHDNDDNPPTNPGQNSHLAVIEGGQSRLRKLASAGTTMAAVLSLALISTHLLTDKVTALPIEGTATLSAFASSNGFDRVLQVNGRYYRVNIDRSPIDPALFRVTRADPIGDEDLVEALSLLRR